MHASGACRTASMLLVAVLLSGCVALSAKPANSTAGTQARASGTDPALDADIQRILAAGGINTPAMPPPIVPQAAQVALPTQAPAVAAIPATLPSLPPAPSGGDQRPVAAASADAPARLDLSALPVSDTTTNPITSTTATYDFSAQPIMSQAGGLMLPGSIPGMPNASVGAGIFPSVPDTSVVTNITGDNAVVAVTAPAPAHRVKRVIPVAIPANIQAVRQQAPTTIKPAATTAALPAIGTPAVGPVGNSDRPLPPVRRF